MKYIITAIICTLILGISFYSVQTNKQESIERQQKAELDYKREVEYREKQEKAELKSKLNTCLTGADIAYWDYMELNGTKKDDGSIWASNYVWGQAQERKENEIDLCFKKYQ